MNYREHKRKWKDCRRCPLWKERNLVVLARGTIPCDVLVIGEAPGVSEDILGKPFIGPAGKLLDEILGEAIGPSYSYAITNLIGCIPKEDGNKVGEPPREAIDACRDRLLEFVDMANPRLAILVGGFAGKFANLTECDSIKITHPAAILRMNIAAQPLEIKRAVATIRDAVEDLS